MLLKQSFSCYVRTSFSDIPINRNEFNKNTVTGDTKLNKDNATD